MYVHVNEKREGKEGGGGEIAIVREKFGNGRQNYKFTYVVKVVNILNVKLYTATSLCFTL